MEKMRQKIIETIKSAVIEYTVTNQLNDYWKEPLVEIISADNEKLKILREAVSPDHFTPYDILPDAKSIISFFIPFHDRIVQSNIGGKLASEEWVLAYIKTNDLIKTIGDAVEKLMAQNGYKAGKIPATHNFDAEKLISRWSHRHIAVIAGLGAFGINNMLITKNGCCGRLGSIVINFKFEAYKETVEIKEKCLNKRNGSCGVCQKKCVVNAYADNKFDRYACYAQCLKNSEHFIDIGYADVCGKCLVGLPCSTAEPA